MIAYWKAPAKATGQPLQGAILNGDFAVLPEMPIATLERIIAEARTSIHLSAAQKRLLPTKPLFLAVPALSAGRENDAPPSGLASVFRH